MAGKKRIIAIFGGLLYTGCKEVFTWIGFTKRRSKRR